MQGAEISKGTLLYFLNFSHRLRRRSELPVANRAGRRFGSFAQVMKNTGHTYTISRADFDAVIFDLDGVITDTASVHAKAWKRMFDDFLKQHAEVSGEPFEPFSIESDYRVYVDGKPRSDGVRSFLKSRDIRLPEGKPDDLPGYQTITGMGKLKNGYFLASIEDRGVDVYASSVELKQ